MNDKEIKRRHFLHLKLMRDFRDAGWPLNEEILNNAVSFMNRMIENARPIQARRPSKYTWYSDLDDFLSDS